MLIRLFNKKMVFLILLSGLYINANASILSGLTKSIENEASTKIQTGLKNKIGGININGVFNQYTKNTNLTFLSNLLSTLLGAKINVKCLVPHFNAGIKAYSVCNFKNKFNFSIGPCSVSADFSQNPLYKNITNICNNKSIQEGISSDSLVNAAYSSMITARALDNGASPSSIKYGNGITFKDAYGSENGKQSGYFTEVAKEYPNTNDAQALLTNDKQALIVKDKLIRTKGTTDLNKAVLPKNLTLYKKAITNNAKIYKQSIPNIIDIISNAQSVLTSNDCLNYIKNSDGTINYNNYLIYYTNYINKPNGTIAKLYQAVDSAIDYEYANKLTVLEAKSKYFEYAPTEAMFKLIPDSKKKKFLYNSTIWTAQETDLLGQKEKAIEKAHLKIRIALRKAYIASMPFDEVKAQKELNALLAQPVTGGGSSGGNKNSVSGAIKTLSKGF